MKTFVFDLDGVVIDTLGPLYSVYLEFLSDFGKQGTQTEFETLNGPKLPEIVAYLRKQHDLSANEMELLAAYQEKVARAYHGIELTDGLMDVLSAVRNKGHGLALVSSASREVIESVLGANDLEFDVVISGDDVPKAKPSPAIYEELRKRLGGEFVVIEDGSNGIEAALAAKMKVIAFKNRHERAVFEIETMDELLAIVNGYRAFKGKVELDLVEHGVSSSEADELWEERKKENPELTDGEILAYLDHTFEEGTLKIRCFFSSYRFFLAGKVSPLSVSGITLDRKGNVLVGVRGRVTEYAGRYELVPSGSLESTDYEGQILKELEEETGISGGAVETLGLIHDIDHDVYDIACRIRVDVIETRTNGEYQRLMVVSEPEGFDLIPTSVALRSLS